MSQTFNYRIILAFAYLSLGFVSQIFSNDNNGSCAESEMNCIYNPVLICPEFVWLKPSESAHPNRTGYPAAFPGGANCGDPIVTYTDEVLIINACHKVYTRIWTATDPNNAALFDTCHQTIKQLDEEAPVFDQVPDDIVIYTDNMDSNSLNCSQQVSWDFPIFYDNHIVQSIELVARKNGYVVDLDRGDIFTDGVTTLTYTLYDFCGNFTEHTFTVTIMCMDCHLDCPDDACLPLDSNIDPSVTGYAVSFSGNMNCGTVDIDYTDQKQDTGCNGKTTVFRTWQGLFSNNPSELSTCVQKIELKDMSAVVLHNCPSDINIANNFTEVHWPEPQATSSDNANVITMTSNFSPGNFFPIGITTIIYTAVDACGNSATCSFKVSVLEDITSEACPDDIEVSCGPDGTATVDWELPLYNGTCTTCLSPGPISGFVYVGSFNGSSYYCSSTDYGFIEAQAKAAELGGHLVSIDSEEENEFVSSHIGSATALIGLSDYESEGDFVWDDGSTLSYTNWYTAQPNDQDNQDFVEIMRSGLWNDIDNETKREIVVEIPCENVRQVSGPQRGDKLVPGVYTVVYHINDGCGVNLFCKFDIIVTEGVSIICQDDIFTEAPLDADFISVSWDAPEAYTCCSSCEDICLELTQIEGPPSGSDFYRQSKTRITYEAVDDCGNAITCSFFILVDIDNTASGGNRMGSSIAGIETLTANSDQAPEPTFKFNLQDFDNESEKIKTSIYPNPTSDILNIDFENPDQVKSIQLVNTSGQVILQTQGVGSKNRYGIGHLQSGVYMIKIINQDKTIKTQRIIIL